MAALLALIAVGTGLRLYAGGLPGELEKDYRDASGSPFLYSYDAFYYLRLAGNVLERGHPGESLRDGEPFDDLSLAPHGRPVGERLLARLQAAVHRLLGGRVPLIRVAFFLPVALGALTIPGIFLLGRRLAGDAGGLTAAFLFAAHPGLVAYGFAGAADTNALLLLLFVLVAWLFLGAVASWRHDRRRAAVAFGVATLAALFLFRLASPGYVAPAALVAVFVLGLGLAGLWRSATAGGWPRTRIRAAGLVLAGLGATGLWVLVSRTRLVRLVLDYAGKRPETDFPSGLAEVSELAPVALPGMGAILGGPLVIGLAAVCLPFAVPRQARLEAGFLFAWLIPPLAAGAAAVRFLPLALPPLVILLGVGIVRAIRWITPEPDPLPERSRRPRPTALRAVLVAAVAGALALSFRPGYAETRATRPPVDRAVAELATSLRTGAPDDAILHVWWDYGYIYAALADRPVTLDGGSFRRPRLYWLSRALTVADEDLAAGILRLVTCGHEDELFDLLEPLTGAAGAVRGIESAVALDGEQAARDAFEDAGLPPSVARRAARLAFCEPAPAFLVLGSDLLAKTGSWAHYGSWRIGLEPPPQVARIERPRRCRRQGPALECVGGERYRLDEPRFVSRHSAGHLAWIAPADRPRLVRVVYQENGSFTTLRLDRALAESVFARLYFFNGTGLSRFELFEDVSYPSTRRALAFRLRW